MQPSTDTSLEAAEAYRRAQSLMQENRYQEALPLLTKAFDAYRKHAAEGHPTEQVMENGVTALSNALYALGICHDRTDDWQRAIECYETAYINERFEHTSAFRILLRDLAPRLATCYERRIASTGAALPHDAAVPLQLDPAFRFPFSLSPEIAPYARLYELAPERYPHIRRFYEAARQQDLRARHSGNATGETVMRRISIGVWGVMAIIWTLYGFMVVRTLMQAR